MRNHRKHLLVACGYKPRQAAVEAQVWRILRCVLYGNTTENVKSAAREKPVSAGGIDGGIIFARRVRESGATGH